MFEAQPASTATAHHIPAAKTHRGISRLAIDIEFVPDFAGLSGWPDTIPCLRTREIVDRSSNCRKFMAQYDQSKVKLPGRRVAKEIAQLVLQRLGTGSMSEFLPSRTDSVNRGIQIQA
jgi:hypothetical protein